MTTRPSQIPLTAFPSNPTFNYPNARSLTATEGTRVRYGVTMFVTDRTMTPAAVTRAAEERGFESFYLPEHTHIPTSRRTPAPTRLANRHARLRDR